MLALCVGMRCTSWEAPIASQKPTMTCGGSLPLVSVHQKQPSPSHHFATGNPLLQAKALAGSGPGSWWAIWAGKSPPQVQGTLCTPATDVACRPISGATLCAVGSMLLLFGGQVCTLPLPVQYPHRQRDSRARLQDPLLGVCSRDLTQIDTSTHEPHTVHVRPAKAVAAQSGC